MEEGKRKINIRTLEEKALVRFRECPKQVTIVRSADQKEDMPFHCIVDTQKSRDFVVPKQEVMLVYDLEYGMFSVVKVRDKDGDGEYALFTSRDRLGFLYPLGELPFEFPAAEESVI